MSLEPLITGISSPEQNKPCMIMDGRGHSHAAWVDGTSLRYFRFNGVSWEYLGDSSMVVSSAGITAPKSCLAVTKTGSPHLLWLSDENKAYHAYWNGEEWAKHGDGLVYPGAVQGAAITTLRSAPYVACIENLLGGDRYIRILNVQSGVWTLLSSKRVSTQDNDSTDMVARPVSDSIYSFWKAERGSDRWICYAIYDTVLDSWTNIPNNRVEVTVTDGDITDFDFAIIKEFWSSSSSSTAIMTSSSSSSSSSTELLTSSSSTSSSSSSSTFICCEMRNCSGDASICGNLTSWTFSGTNQDNTDNCTLYVQAVYTAFEQWVNITSDAAWLNQVAEGHRLAQGTIVLEERNSSGVSGTVYWNGIQIGPPTADAVLSC